jgi:NADH dehydrogenase
MDRQVVTVFGGSGFVGRHLVQRLANAGWIIRVAVRDPEAASFLKPLGDAGQIVPLACDIRAESTVKRAVDGADAVVNLVGILYESRRRTFNRIHVEGARGLAQAAADAGATRFVQMSALGANANSPSVYARTKAAGESAVLEIFPDAGIARPSVVFGPEDDFFNRFARMARITPIMPVFETSFQPVYVGDVADAMVCMLEGKAVGGTPYELGGPRVISFREVMELMLEAIHRKRTLVPMPFSIAKLQASILQFLPVPPLTPDQVELLQIPNVVSKDALTLLDLGIQPTSVESVIPAYLARYIPPLKQPLAAR